MSLSRQCNSVSHNKVKMKIILNGSRTLPEKVTIEIVPSIFMSDENLFEDAKKIKKLLFTYIPVRTYEYLQKLLKK